MTHYNDFLGKLILSQHSFYSSARPCGIAHAQIHCHPKTKSKVRPKKKTRDTRSERSFSWESDRNDFHWNTLGWSTKHQATIVIKWDETSVRKIMDIQTITVQSGIPAALLTGNSNAIKEAPHIRRINEDQIYLQHMEWTRILRLWFLVM